MSFFLVFFKFFSSFFLVFFKFFSSFFQVFFKFFSSFFQVFLSFSEYFPLNFLKFFSDLTKKTRFSPNFFFLSKTMFFLNCFFYFILQKIAFSLIIYLSLIRFFSEGAVFVIAHIEEAIVILIALVRLVQLSICFQQILPVYKQIERIRFIQVHFLPNQQR